jgi:hypothetical protein
MLKLSVVFSGGGSRAASLYGGKTSASEGCYWAVDCGAAETSSTETAAAAKNSRECESKVSKIISVLLWTQPRPVVLASTFPLHTAPRFQSWAGFAARSRNIVTCGSVPTSLSVVSEARVSKLHTRARCVCALSIQRLEGRRWRLRRMRTNGYGNSIFSPICKLLVLR